MWQISAGLGLALALTLGAFKLYHDKVEAEREAFYLQLEQSIQNQWLDKLNGCQKKTWPHKTK